MQNILFDDPHDWENLLPFTFTRSVSDIRIGITTIREKWQYALGRSVNVLTQDYLSEKYPIDRGYSQSVYINGSILPDASLMNEIFSLRFNQKLVKGNVLIAAYTDHRDKADMTSLVNEMGKLNSIEYGNDLVKISYPWEIFKYNGAALTQDFRQITKGRQSETLSETNLVIGENPVFVEKGASIEACIINTTGGPVYIGKNAEVMEGCLIRGPLALCEGAGIKMGAKIYGPTTIGPHCKVGGEINNSVLFGYSNKAHDGFLGNSVIGEWCNLGADTNNSNLKNNYGNVRVWNYKKKDAIDTSTQFCGIFMGDHSKSGINTMFNTGTVVGVCANVFGGDFPPKHIPSFSWGGAAGMKRFDLDKAYEVAGRVMSRRNIQLSEIEKNILKYISEHYH